jgi:hypothetical protein
MRDIFTLFLHAIVTIIRLAQPYGRYKADIIADVRRRLEAMK